MTVYYAVDDSTGLIKIGTTNRDPHLRAAELGARLVATEPGSFGEERQRHAQFAAARVHSEWFTATAELTAHVDALGPPEPKPLTATERKQQERQAPCTVRLPSPEECRELFLRNLALGAYSAYDLQRIARTAVLIAEQRAAQQYMDGELTGRAS